MNKFIAISACLKLSTLAHPGKLKPPKFPVVVAKPFQKGEQGKDLEFKFAVLNFGDIELNFEDVYLKKVDFKNKALVNSEFELVGRVIKGEELEQKMKEVKEKIEDNGDEIKDKVEEKTGHRPGPRPHPRTFPKPNSAIIGKAESKGLSCDDQDVYILAYGYKPEPKEGKEQRRPRPGPSPKPYRKIVEGCRKSDPKPLPAPKFPVVAA